MSSEINTQNAEESVETARGGKRRKDRREEKAAGRKKRKFKKRYIAIGAAAVLLVGYFAFSQAASGNTVMPVSCVNAYTGDVEENVSASGKVGSAKTKTYFAPVGAKIDSLQTEVGSEVKAGDLLLSFDTSQLELEKTKADLQASQASSSYKSAMQESNENQSEYADASLGLEELKTMEENQKQYVQDLKYELEDDMADKKQDLYDWDKKLQQELNYQNRRLAEAVPGSEEADNIHEVIDNVSGQRSDVQNELSMLDNDENLKQKQRQIDFEEKKLSDMTEEISRRESKQSSSEAGIMNGYSKQEKQISVESADVSAREAADELTTAQAGVVAEFDGIVTEVAVVEGATVAEGAQLFTIESSQDVKVTVELSKYDLEKVKEGQEAELTIAGSTYRGKVEKINRMAQNNQQNTPVVNADITVLDPDSGIFLGVEGKASIRTAKSEGVVLVPYEAINTDKDGDFCYVVTEGIVGKCRIVTGISNDTEVEVKEGIAAGDVVIIASNMNLEEGMQVMPVIQ